MIPMEFANVSGPMVRVGSKLRMDLDVETLLGVHASGQTQDNAGPVLQTPPKPAQVDQLAVQLASPRLLQWESHRLRMRRYRTQIKHIQESRIMELIKAGYSVDVLPKLFWSHCAQATLEKWLRKGPRLAVADEAAPIVQVQAQASKADSSSDSSSTTSSSSSSSSDDENDNDEDKPESGAGEEAEAHVEEEVVAGPSMEEVLAENQQLRDKVLRLELAMENLEYEKAQIEDEHKDLIKEYGRLAAKLNDLKAPAKDLRPPAKKTRFE